MHAAMEGGNGDDKKKDKIVKFPGPKKPEGSREREVSAPIDPGKKEKNIARLPVGTDEPHAMVNYALFMHDDMLRVIQEEMPELGVSQSEVDMKIQEFLDVAEKSGLNALEDEVEKAHMKDVEISFKEKPEMVRRLALATAYLRLTGGDF